jgi:hypothetical protein
MLSAYTLIVAIVKARQKTGADAAKDENERHATALAASAALGSLFRYVMACCAFVVSAEGCRQDNSENKRRDVETTARPI